MKSVLIIVDTEDKNKNLRNEIVRSIDKHLGAEFEKKFLYLDKMNISSCLGCFNCWIKTPGKCIIADDNEIKNKLFVECDYIIAISKITYGMYSSTFKVVLDRIIPNISPFFKFIDGEMHHKKRYKKDFKLFIIGYGENLLRDEKKTFKELFYRNMINFQYKHNEFLIVENENIIQEKIYNKLNTFCEVS